MPRVLIVDDDISIRTHLASYVRDLDHEVEAAGDAMEALAAMDGGAIDVIFSDVRIAGMDRLTFFLDIRLRHPASGAILVTWYTDSPDAGDVVSSGIPN